MRIRFVTLYYPPEVGAAQRRISELARRLAELGHKVTVVTGFPNYPSGIKPGSYRGKFSMREEKDGYTIIRLPHYVAPNKGFLKRILIHLTYAFSACIYTLFMKRDDVVYVESPPLFNGFIGLVGKWIRRIPYVFNVADLWPQTAIELGMLRNKPIIKFTQFLEKLFYNQSIRILAITAGVRASICEMGYDKDFVPLITNGVDIKAFNESVEPDKEVLSHKNKDGLLVVYAGTHGLIYSLDTILQAAEIVEDDNIQFVFIGGGADKQRIVNLARDMKLKNVTFLPPKPSDVMPSVFRAADVAVISLRDLPVSKKIIPMKSFEIMGVGVPIILATKGEIAGYLKKADNGFIVEPENPRQLAEALKTMAGLSKEDRYSLGHNGRNYVVENFSHEKITKKLEAILSEAISDDE
ncbi:MAG: glycosyltransferase family 4 protein [candidate division Zixibacteria bacterium]|nr:glycosyltransferase family 4 protein [candidate division Zixibacteria bacterium]